MPSNPIALLTLCLTTLPTAAQETYHCIGHYNTGATYNHLYEIEENSVGGDVLRWDRQIFTIHDEMMPLRIYATHVGASGVDVLYIDRDTLAAEFASIRFRNPLIAKGQCQKIE
ncbi:hypothetical protein [Neptuniibacter halophilus]|uniref:hypothetical protein n=1 Tax=Neptuniibacter halophilus TaxID=651666 RepID=UPI002572B88D|nr:hypothetical protein [Neptuniibacter halophilus]